MIQTLGRYYMQKTSMSLSKLWCLLRNQEKQLGLDKLSLTERDIFLCILFHQEHNKLISLENIIKNCRHPRATLFRCLKKLRLENIIQIKKDTTDTRKSLISISSKYL